MIPSVGATCSFEFTTPFATLNGVYRIRAETTFNDSIASGVDFVSNLYTPAGRSQADFNADFASYKTDRVTILESVVDNTVVYYTPESIFAKVPDPTVREYFPLVLVVDVGVQKNTQKILPLIDQVKDLIQATLGTTDPLRIITNPANKVYLTDAQYATLEAAREANIEELVPLSVQLKQEQDNNTFLAAKCAAYEALIAQLSGAVPPTP